MNSGSRRLLPSFLHTSSIVSISKSSSLFSARAADCIVYPFDAILEYSSVLFCFKIYYFRFRLRDTANISLLARVSWSLQISGTIKVEFYFLSLTNCSYISIACIIISTFFPQNISIILQRILTNKFRHGVLGFWGFLLHKIIGQMTLIQNLLPPILVMRLWKGWI